ncbi:MAG: ATP-binding protein [Planctomycetes bacterium]|nr:ATP-binding protein [Planctomycetota bacterium]
MSEVDAPHGFDEGAAAAPGPYGRGFTTARDLRLRLPSTHDAVRLARSMLRHFARLQGLHDREVERLMLVSSELLANAVDHGGGGAALDDSQLLHGASMGLHLLFIGHGWRLEVSDQGGGDPEAMRRRLLPKDAPDELDERGRGMFLIAELVDHVEVHRTSDNRGLVVSVARDDVRK